MIPVALVVIAQNEEVNIRYCLDSVRDWCKEMYVVDSFSTDQTAALARQAGASVAQHTFEDWAAQRNWALDHLPLQTEWVMFLDADEQLTDALKREIEQALATVRSDVSAFAIQQAFVFLGRHLKHAYDGPPLVRLVRRHQVSWFCQGAREYCQVQGSVGQIRSRIWHEDHKGLSVWIEKQNRNATREARLMWQHMTASDSVQTSERRLRAWVRDRVWIRLPLFFRPLLYFFYRYLLRGGFLDGQAGLIYSFLHGLWFNFLIDAKYRELVLQSRH
jgi:glycosyltransferase involved in cell wall biosynthesis